MHKGAFDTKNILRCFLFAFCLSAIAYFEPRDYRVVFVIQKKQDDLAVILFFYISNLDLYCG